MTTRRRIASIAQALLPVRFIYRQSVLREAQLAPRVHRLDIASRVAVPARKLTTIFAAILSTILLFSSSPARASDDARPASSTLEAARAAAKGDALLEALLTELDRSKSQLKMDQVQAPYYIEYRVDEVEDFAAEAAFGALRSSEHNRVRVLRVVVRIGNYKLDSFFGQGEGEANILPLDNDPIALRHQIWLATDDAYKSAGEAYAEKQAAMKQFSAEANPVDDFAKAPVVTELGDTAKLKIDEAGWKKTLEDASGLYRQYPDLQSVSASIRCIAFNEYFVNSEGTITRGGSANYSVQLNAGAQAADGMRLNRSPAWMVARPEELPTRQALLSDTKTTLDTLMALRNAPIVEEEYRGPVLFAPDAANDVIASLVGANVIGRKPPLGKPNRTLGQFATSYKTRVLPNFVSVVDDPTLKEFQGKSLVGSYAVDSEGVKAQPVTLVQGGMLTNYLIGREPIRDFVTSNGHSRAAPGSLPSPTLGVLLVKSSEPQSPLELKKRMIQMIADEGRNYAYRVETLGPGNSPRLLYRVYKDGHEELVRGAVFNELDVRALRSDLIALGNDPLVNNRQGGIPVTIITPSLLFQELEVKRADTSKEKLPDYPPPPLKTGK
jgi:TldD protein